MAKPNNKSAQKLPKTAAKLITTQVPVVQPGATIEEVEKILLEKTRQLETINYIYVMDLGRRLIGVISIKEIFRSPKKTKIDQVMIKKLITARPHTDLQHVALLAIKHSLKAIPVVDNDGMFLGVVPSDLILSALHHKNIEDALRFAGVHPFKDPAKTIITATALVHLKKRLPWLILGLLGGTLAALIVRFFEDSLRVQITLAAFIPLVVYLAGAIGTQTSTIYIRSLAIEHKLNISSYILREIKVSIGIALILSVLVSFLAFLITGSSTIGIILGLSIFTASWAAMAIAMILPSLFLKIKKDPAIATGPFATVVTDIVSLLIYFGIIELMLTAV